MEWKIMIFIVASNIVASRPAERRPTGTPTVRANYSDNPSDNPLGNYPDYSRNFPNSHGDYPG